MTRLAAQALDLVVPFAVLLRKADGPVPFERWTEVIWRFLPHTFFVYWLFSFIPIVGGLVYMLVLVPLAVLRGATGPALPRLLRAWVVILIGFGSIRGFIGHVFLSDQVATGIGWAPGSPFQTELAFASLGIGVAALLAIWIRDNLVTAVVLAKSIFWYGAAYTHLRDWIGTGNTEPYNVGGPLIGDLVFPTLLLWLLWRTRHPAQTVT